MRTIYKYPIDKQNVTIDLPYHHSVVAIGAQPINGGSEFSVESTPMIWIEHETERRKSPVRFIVVGTGHEIPMGFVHVGTVMISTYVWHVYKDVNAYSFTNSKFKDLLN